MGILEVFFLLVWKKLMEDQCLKKKSFAYSVLPL